MNIKMFKIIRNSNDNVKNLSKASLDTPPLIFSINDILTQKQKFLRDNIFEIIQEANET